MNFFMQAERIEKLTYNYKQFMTVLMAVLLIFVSEGNLLFRLAAILFFYWVYNILYKGFLSQKNTPTNNTAFVAWFKAFWFGTSIAVSTIWAIYVSSPGLQIAIVVLALINGITYGLLLAFGILCQSDKVR